MPAPDAQLPTDSYENALVALYERADRRVRFLISQSVTAGRLEQAAYREAQLAQIDQALARARRAQSGAVEIAVRGSYGTAAMAMDLLMPGRAAATFGGVHERSVQVLVKGLSGRLDEALLTVGRRSDDLFRRVALETIAESQATGEPTAITARRIEQGLVDHGATAFVDRRGARWKLSTYSRMAARTTLRETVTVASVNRILENGGDLVTVSRHSHHHDVCSPYDGQTFSLTGQTPGYPILPAFPPFHPNCTHVLTPAEAELQAYASALGVVLPA